MYGFIMKYINNKFGDVKITAIAIFSCVPIAVERYMKLEINSYRKLVNFSEPYQTSSRTKNLNYENFLANAT